MERSLFQALASTMKPRASSFQGIFVTIASFGLPTDDATVLPSEAVLAASNSRCSIPISTFNRHTARSGLIDLVSQLCFTTFVLVFFPSYFWIPVHSNLTPCPGAVDGELYKAPFFDFAKHHPRLFVPYTHTRFFEPLRIHIESKSNNRTRLMHFRSFSFRHKSGDKKKSSSSSSELETVSPPDPFLPHKPLPPTSIANIVLDPGNLTALYLTASTPSTPNTPNTSDTASSSDASNPITDTTSSGFGLGIDSSPFSPHNQPKKSISDLVFDTTTLSALYDTREAERNVAAVESKSSFGKDGERERR
ncbi:hypothetical protein C8R41DRAFT_915069 [Lentinula lateritia]|uniref:Uncharacterized protein n=1 Tax=Lentinula lateritia TaxID=40482 RepID=A0ABQ8VTV2_9AGAR|nr:hypothetical protein C8R41DRAFT_915069 [Lentinula lateritia]